MPAAAAIWWATWWSWLITVSAVAAEVGWAVRDARPADQPATAGLHREAVRPQCLEVLTSRKQAHLVAGGRQHAADKAAHCSGAENTDAHVVISSWTSA